MESGRGMGKRMQSCRFGEYAKKGNYVNWKKPTDFPVPNQTKQNLTEKERWFVCSLGVSPT